MVEVKMIIGARYVYKKVLYQSGFYYTVSEQLAQELEAITENDVPRFVRVTEAMKAKDKLKKGSTKPLTQDHKAKPTEAPATVVIEEETPSVDDGEEEEEDPPEPVKTPIEPKKPAAKKPAAKKTPAKKKVAAKKTSKAKSKAKSVPPPPPKKKAEGDEDEEKVSV